MKTIFARPASSLLAILVAASISAGAPPARAQSGPTTTVFATTGPGTLSAVPGAPRGTTFLSFGAPSIYDPYGLGALVTIQPAPTLTFAASVPPANPAPIPAIVRLVPPVVVTTTIRAIQSAPQSIILVQAGDPAPDVKGAVFTKFGQPVFGGGSGGGPGYGFLATIANSTGSTGVTKSTETGLWSDCTGSLDLVARTGDPAPGVTGATFTQFISYVLPALDANATSNLQRTAGLVFLAKIQGPGVSAKNNLGVWLQDGTKTPGSDVSLLFRTGDSITMPDKGDTIPIKGLQLFLPSKDMPGQRRSYTADGVIMALATFAQNRSCVIAARPSNDSSYQVDPNGILENTNVGHPSMPTALSQFYFAMRAKLFRNAALTQGPGKVTAKNDTVILVGNNQHFFNRQYQTGEPVFFIDNATYVDFGDPAADGRFLGDIIFSAKIAGPGIDKTNDSLLVSDFDFAALARTGDQAVGAPEGVKWKSFVSYALPETNGEDNPNDFHFAFFLARLTGTGVNATNDTGLWGRDDNSVLHLLVRTGDPFTVADGDTRTVAMISTLNAVADSAGQSRFVDVFGDITALLTFTDHSTALVGFSLP